MTQQLPQNNLKIDCDFFEYVILFNALMDEPYLSSIVDIVQPAYFKSENVRCIWSTVKEYYKKKSVVPNLTELRTYLTTEDQKKSYKDVLLNFKQLDTKYNKESLIETTETFLKERAVYNAVLQTANGYSRETSKINPGLTLKLFEDACNISLIEDLGCSYFDSIDKHITDIKEVHEYISTGYKWLDKKMGGGFFKDGRALYVFSGVTNVGKSIVLGNLATNMVNQGKVVVIISMEMSENIYAQRISGQLSRIPIHALKEEADHLKDFLLKYKTQHPYAKLFIKEYPPKSVTVNTIKAYIQKLITQKKVKPDAIILDYVNLIQPTIISGNLYTDVKMVAEQIRALSYIFRCPTVTATQLNRSAFEELNPGLETTSESMGLAMTADFQACIWSSDTDKELGILHLGIQKNRMGQNFGSTTFRIDYDSLAIDETEDEQTDNTQVHEAETTLGKLAK